MAVHSSTMVRVLWATLVLVASGACGNVTRDEAEAATGGAAAGTSTGGASTAGASTGGASPGGASTAGANTAGTSAIQTAVLECERYCETLSFRLPGALCEDWSRIGLDSEFCYLAGPTETCADYCNSVYETVSPAC